MTAASSGLSQKWQNTTSPEADRISLTVSQTQAASWPRRLAAGPRLSGPPPLTAGRDTAKAAHESLGPARLDSLLQGEPVGGKQLWGTGEQGPKVTSERDLNCFHTQMPRLINTVSNLSPKQTGAAPWSLSTLNPFLSGGCLSPLLPTAAI